MSRVILIGIDGATPQLLYPWIKDGKLPNFQKMKQNGSWGKLKSTIPPFSAPAWTSIITGCNPGKHGVYGFESTGTINSHLINSRYRKKPAIWNYLTKIGLKSIVINVPGTYPPEKIDGVMITGLLTPSYESNFIYPNNLKDRLNSNDLGEYELEQFWVEDFSRSKMKKRNPQKLLDNINKQMESRAVVGINLMKQYKWDFSMIVFRGTDTAQHFLFDHEDLLLSCYQKVDELLGRMMKNFPNDIFIIVSDHGFERIERIFYPDNVLYNNGFLTPIYDPFNDSKSRFDLIFNRLYNMILTLLPNKFLKQSRLIRKLLLSGSSKSKLINFSQTQAFSTADGRGIQICLNGNISKDNIDFKEYDNIIKDIVRLFRCLIDPDDKKNIITDIYRWDEAYGKSALSPPDLVFSLKKGITAAEWIRFPGSIKEISESKERNIKYIFNKDTIGRSGDHSQYGVFFAYGNNIKSNFEIKNISVEDILPLVFSNLGFSLPNGIDGTLKEELFLKNPIINLKDWDNDFKKRDMLTKSEIDKISKIKDMFKK